MYGFRDVSLELSLTLYLLSRITVVGLPRDYELPGHGFLARVTVPAGIFSYRVSFEVQSENGRLPL